MSGPNLLCAGIDEHRLTASQPFPQPMTPNDEAFFRSLGARLARLRLDAGLSQQAVADALGLPQQTYANYEVARARVQQLVIRMLDGVLASSSR